MRTSWRRFAGRGAVAYGFVVSRWGPAVAAAFVAATALSIAVAPHTYQQPFSSLQKPLPVAPLAPALPALLVGFAFTNSMAVLERPVGRRLAVARAAWAAVMIAAAMAGAGVASAVVDAPPRLVMIRNAAGLTGLTLLVALLVGSRVAWIAVLAPVAATVVAGRDGRTGAVHRWSLLMAPADSAVAMAIAAGVVVAGVAGYARWDTRPSLGVLKE